MSFYARVQVDPAQAQHQAQPIRLQVVSLDDPAMVKTEDSVFIGE